MVDINRFSVDRFSYSSVRELEKLCKLCERKSCVVENPEEIQDCQNFKFDKSMEEETYDISEEMPLSLYPQIMINKLKKEIIRNEM